MKYKNHRITFDYDGLVKFNFTTDEIIEDRLDKEIAGNMITDERFKVGIENWLDVYSFFTPEQRDFIKKFTRGI